MNALLWLLFGLGQGPLPDIPEPPRLPYFLAYDGTGDAIIVVGDEITIDGNHFFVSIGGYLYPASDKQFAIMEGGNDFGARTCLDDVGAATHC